MSYYGNLLTLREDWKSLKKGYWKATSKLLKMFPKIIGLTPNYICTYMYRETGQKMWNYFYKSLPQYFTYDGIEKLLLEFYNLYVNDSSIDRRKRLLAKERWEKLGDKYLSQLKINCSLCDMLYNLEPFVFESYEDTKVYTLELLRLGKLEDENSEPSGEMIKWIQESVNKVHPKSFIKSKGRKKKT